MDYISNYIKDNKFNLDELIEDDFWKAIKLCYNNKYYVSSVKLLLSFIDSISFLAYGNSDSKTFQKWLSEFCELEKLNITAFELWEHRNALLHTTGLNSRKVDRLECRMLISYVGELPKNYINNIENSAHFNIKELIDVVAFGVQKYVLGILTTDQLVDFIDRYDLIVSDVRTLNIKYEE